MKKFTLTAAFTMLALVGALFASSDAFGKRNATGGRGNGPVIYVASQGLYYDSIITADPVPPVGPFQELWIGPNGLTTAVGPGDPGHVGGRWMEDIDGDGVYHFFVCPLLGPGRASP